MSNPENIKENLKLLIPSIIIISIYAVPWLILGILHWMDKGFTNNTDVSYLVNLCFSIICLVTIFNLWSRSSQFQKSNIKKLFIFTTLSFVVLLIIFVYLLLNGALLWYVNTNIYQYINESIPTIYFDNFGIEGNTLAISSNSSLTFSIFLISIALYLFPIEKYAKHSESLPWHTISILICFVLVPILFLFRNYPFNLYVLSIGTLFITVCVGLNCLYLFYLYFSMGIKSPKRSSMRKASFLIGFGLILIFTLIVLKVGVLVMLPSLMASETATSISFETVIGELSFGLIGIVFLNYGFYLMRPS